ncbi:MAG TPA: hypothetical protein VHB02_06650 [Acidimicrobiales bacterium]|nr:hypothetical protein [Acidimicrobiales bacterium]
MALTTAGLRAFREAATLADLIPTLRIRVRDGERPVCVVTGTPDPSDGTPSVPLCAFRRGVGHAYRQHRMGTRMQFLDVPADREPSIDIGLPAGDATLPGQIYRIGTHDGGYLLLFVTELDPVAAREAMDQALAAAATCHRGTGCPAQPAGEPRRVRRIGLHADEVTGLTAVHTICDPGEVDRAVAAMTRMLEVCVATEAIADLAAATAAASEDGRP